MNDPPSFFLGLALGFLLGLAFMVGLGAWQAALTRRQEREPPAGGGDP